MKNTMNNTMYNISYFLWNSRIKSLNHNENISSKYMNRSRKYDKIDHEKYDPFQQYMLNPHNTMNRKVIPKPTNQGLLTIRQKGPCHEDTFDLL